MKKKNILFNYDQMIDLLTDKIRNVEDPGTIASIIMGLLGDKPEELNFLVNSLEGSEKDLRYGVGDRALIHNATLLEALTDIPENFKGEHLYSKVFSEVEIVKVNPWSLKSYTVKINLFTEKDSKCPIPYFHKFFDYELIPLKGSSENK